MFFWLRITFSSIKPLKRMLIARTANPFNLGLHFFLLSFVLTTFLLMQVIH